ncbi:MAG: hypothetical protein HYY60_01490 [Parcubacteria group bacterium]|nr:hypothetical protein [Parcubacteria group bacterium]
MKPYSVDEQKWRAFSTDMQLKNIAAEFSRAAHAGGGMNEEQKEQEKGAYERAIALIDAAIADPQWGKDGALLYRLRDAAASLYARGGDVAVSRFIGMELLRE